MDLAKRPGAVLLQDGSCRFRVWAPLTEKVELHILEPEERLLPLQPVEGGYHEVVTRDVSAGARYRFRLAGNEDLPDPASRFQPLGVHGPSEVVDTRFQWNDTAWTGLSLADFVVYELHVGTFTPEGTFAAIIPRLDDLRELGITALELMPIAQFPGNRNWGYDGVYPFAAQESYGGPAGLKALVEACHSRGIAVVLDVVYNHLGPEGNYLGQFGPYFTDKYRTPWGAAVNFDDPECDGVRDYFLQNALYWIRDLHVDALRLDALHAVYDQSALPFLEELSLVTQQFARESGRRVILIAESDLNAPRLILPRGEGGYGLDAQWSDDFHHALHTLLTGESEGYYQDFGRVTQMVKVFRQGYAYTGEYSASRRRRHGRPSRGCRAQQFVVCSQNHDQIGNRMLGERLSALASFEQLKLAASTVILSPFVPLLFMGEEYGESAPFQYFVSHSDEVLIEAVRRGRREEFDSFAWKGEAPDPQSEQTFLRSRLNPGLKTEKRNATLLAFYRELLRLRKSIPALSSLDFDSLETFCLEEEQLVCLKRQHGDSEVLLLLHFGGGDRTVDRPLPAGRWMRRLDSADQAWLGPGSTVPEIIEDGESIRLSFAPSQGLLLERPVSRRPGRRAGRSRRR